MKIVDNRTHCPTVSYGEVKVGDCWQYEPTGGPAMKTQHGSTNAVSLATGNNFYVKAEERVFILPNVELIIK